MMLQSLSLLAVQYGLGTAMLEAWGNLGTCATWHSGAGLMFVSDVLGADDCF